MRKRFEPQFVHGQKLIEGTPIPKKSRDALAALVAALKEIYVTPEYNGQVYKILEDGIIAGKKVTGRPGMHLCLGRLKPGWVTERLPFSASIFRL